MFEVTEERNLYEFYIANDKIKFISDMAPLNRSLFSFYCYDLNKSIEECGIDEMNDIRNVGIFCFDCIAEESEYVHEQLDNGAKLGDLV